MANDDKNEELLDGVEAIMLELLSHDDPVKRQEFIDALIHDGFDPELVYDLAKDAMESKLATKKIL